MNEWKDVWMGDELNERMKYLPAKNGWMNEYLSRKNIWLDLSL